MDVHVLLLSTLTPRTRRRRIWESVILMNMEMDGIEAELIEMSSVDDPNKGMVPASESSIAKVLKRVRVGGGGADHDGREAKKRRVSASESENCTVCMEDFGGGSEQVVASMPCEHVFHEDCIVTWLKQSYNCPVCRFEVSTTD